MARGKYRGGKATGRRTFTSREELEQQDSAAAGSLNPTAASDSEGESGSEGEQEGERTQKPRGGKQPVIETANPNAAPRRQNIKASELKNDDSDDDEPGGGSKKPELSRREREELEKQRAQERYWKLHAQGKTEQAKGDLARLAIIRKQREEEAAKRAAELAAKNAK